MSFSYGLCASLVLLISVLSFWQIMEKPSSRDQHNTGVSSNDILFAEHSELIQRHFPNSTHFSAHSIDSFTDVIMNEFFARNPQLKTVRLIFCKQLTLSVFESMDKLNELETLELSFYMVSGQALPTTCKPVNLKSLKNLSLNGQTMISIILSAISGGNDTLEMLELHGCEYNDELIDAICRFKEIKILELKGSYINDEHILKLSKNLPQLKTVKLFGTTLGVTSNGVIHFIDNCKNLNYLSIFYRIENPKLNIDSHFHEMVSRIIKNRNEDVKLKIELSCTKAIEVTKDGIKVVYDRTINEIT